MVQPSPTTGPYHALDPLKARSFPGHPVNGVVSVFSREDAYQICASFLVVGCPNYNDFTLDGMSCPASDHWMSIKFTNVAGPLILRRVYLSSPRMSHYILIICGIHSILVHWVKLTWYHWYNRPMLCSWGYPHNSGPFRLYYDRKQDSSGANLEWNSRAHCDHMLLSISCKCKWLLTLFLDECGENHTYHITSYMPWFQGCVNLL